MPPSFLHQYEIFYQKAIADLTLVKEVLSIENSKIERGIILFHLQQAAEKFLKSLLSYRGIHFGKVHDIEKILDIYVSQGIPVPSYTKEFIDLSPYAVEGRYDFITDENIDIRRFVSLIEDFKHFIDIQLGLRT